MLLESRYAGGHAAPYPDVVHESVAATIGEIGFRVAKFHEVILIVWQPWHVGLHILTRRGARPRRICLEDHRLGRSEQLSCPENLACPARMRRGHEVWMRTVSFVPCEGQHLLAQGGQHDRR